MARFELRVTFDDNLADDDTDDPALYVKLAASNAIHELRNRPGITIEEAVLTDGMEIVADRDGTMLPRELWPQCETAFNE